MQPRHGGGAGGRGLRSAGQARAGGAARRAPGGAGGRGGGNGEGAALQHGQGGRGAGGAGLGADAARRAHRGAAGGAARERTHHGARGDAPQAHHGDRGQAGAAAAVAADGLRHPLPDVPAAAAARPGPGAPGRRVAPPPRRPQPHEAGGAGGRRLGEGRPPGAARGVRHPHRQAGRGGRQAARRPPPPHGQTESSERGEREAVAGAVVRARPQRLGGGRAVSDVGAVARRRGPARRHQRLQQQRPRVTAQHRVGGHRVAAVLAAVLAVLAVLARVAPSTRRVVRAWECHRPRKASPRGAPSSPQSYNLIYFSLRVDQSASTV